MSDLSRRALLALLGAAAWPTIGRPGARRLRSPADAARFRIRTVTAGTTLPAATDLGAIERAVRFLARARQTVEAAGYELQTVRIATQPFLLGLGPRARADALPAIQALDRAAHAASALLALGPVFGGDAADSDFAPWAAELARTTENVSFSVNVLSPAGGVSTAAVRAAAEAMVAIARATPGGIGNFRFAAAANVPAGTPFFPVAYHAGTEAYAIGLESPPLLAEAFAAPHTVSEGRSRLAAVLETRLAAVEQLAQGIAPGGERRYLGIDASPAPGKGEASIGAAIEALSGVPFGSAGTLAACAAITDVLKHLGVKTCGYSGLMLPVLEDPVLARRAAEGRYSVRELLLYSSVCGTGLDVVPLPGDTTTERVAALVGDMAALSVKLSKPLSARLFLIPGKAAGELAHFDDPFLTDSVVLKAE